MKRLLALVLVAASSVGVARASRPDTVLVLEMVARFRGAVSVSADASGEIVVADRARDVVYRLGVDGRELEAIGGPGSQAARFDDPLGIDATNGLILLVADAGNGRIQRFARDGRFLEWVPVWSDPERISDGPAYLERDARPVDVGDGRPSDVVLTDDGRVFAIEEISATVRTWDRERRPGHAIGTAVGDAMPGRPVALATDGERVYVADADLPGIVVLDRFGRPTTTMGSGVGGGVRSVAAGGGCIWMLTSGRLAGFDPSGALVTSLEIPVPEPIVDLAVTGTRILVLTAKALYRGLATCPAAGGQP